MLIFMSLAQALEFTDAKKVFEENASKIISSQYACEPQSSVVENHQKFLYDINKDSKKDIVIPFQCTKEGEHEWLWSRFGFMVLLQSSNSYRYFDTVLDANFTKVASDGTLLFYSLDSVYTLEAPWIGEGEANARARIVGDRLVHIDRSYQEGKFFLNQKNNDRAKESFQACLLADPRFHLCYWELGWAYWNENEWDKTIDMWDKVLELQPTDKNAKKYIPKAQKKRREAAKSFWEKTWGYEGAIQKDSQKHYISLSVKGLSTLYFVGEYTFINETSIGLRADCEVEEQCGYVTKKVYTCKGKRTATEKGEIISFDSPSCPTLERRGHMCFMNDIRIQCSTEK